MMQFSCYNKTSEELKSINPKFAALPIGAFEQHGPHLPMSTDTIIGVALGNSLCQSLNGLLLPPITISCSHEHYGFFGNAFISAETLIRTIQDIVTSLKHSNINTLVLINAHGGNYVLRNVAQELNLEKSKILLFPTNTHWKEALPFAGIESNVHDDMHAGEIETSILLDICPELVRADKLQDHTADDRSFLHLLGMKGYTTSGVIGLPSLASAKKGKLLIEGLTKSACKDLISILDK
jgi:creatinine amidohydrolase